MRSCFRRSLLVSLVTPLALLACAAPAVRDSDVDVVQEGIQAGADENGFPAVGFVLFAGNPGGCTGSLVAPSLVLTEAHCFSDDFGRDHTPEELARGTTFSTGSIVGLLSIRHVRKVYLHPTRDMALLRLELPINDIVPVDLGPFPDVNTICHAVGFGRHTEGGVDVKSRKRIDTEIVNAAEFPTITTGRAANAVDGHPPGIIDHGDSGGPLFCDGRVVGTTDMGDGDSFALYNALDAWVVNKIKVIGDIDGDRRSDVTLTGGKGWQRIPVATAKADGTFTLTNLVSPTFPFAATIGNARPVYGDFDGDFRTDLALVGGNIGGITLATSVGDGTFTVSDAPLLSFGVLALQANAKPVTGDFDGDALSDIALVGANTDAVPIAMSNGDGTFRFTNLVSGPFGAFARQAGAKPVAGDFNGDGLADIALTGGIGWGSVPVAFSKGDGTFTVTNFGADLFPTFAAHAGAKPVAGDFDGDGIDDIALTGGIGWGSIPVALSKSDGHFEVKNLPAPVFAPLAASSGARPIVGDFNSDGLADIGLTGHVGWSVVQIAQSNGNGTFTAISKAMDILPTLATQAGAKPVGPE